MAKWLLLRTPMNNNQLLQLNLMETRLLRRMKIKKTSTKKEKGRERRIRTQQPRRGNPHKVMSQAEIRRMKGTWTVDQHSITENSWRRSWNSRKWYPSHMTSQKLKRMCRIKYWALRRHNKNLNDKPRMKTKIWMKVLVAHRKMKKTRFLRRSMVNQQHRALKVEEHKWPTLASQHMELKKGYTSITDYLTSKILWWRGISTTRL